MSKQHKAVLTGKMLGRDRHGIGLFIELNPPVAGRKYAVMNSETRGYRKSHSWVGEDRLDIEVFYSVGPDALMIREI